ncbi:MAG: dephospho-CoA kinase [Actinobacteria bacterium]|jgi:dephospho-CoA kinase|nr:dephospho-CoA kinase [Actinomycetota bacterium]NBO50988.1 dephospho-CoA kinase [Actinomycetota bacterium]NBQ59961.1 dephospho-CoA kinase [Actinomycetota bacterium]NCA25405.1 dephospho-CoA kinase [Actinomycetota bacterium]NCU77753.1 dephospho-CoA kinase [Actinomycetota bacterium]
MLIVALTGGIGSGKSTVGEIFSQLGAVVVDSDQIARNVIERGTSGFDLLVATFGDGILKNGDIDRAALSTLVFSDPKKRELLEQITHPLIRSEFSKIVKSLPEETIVVNQIPLLFESKGDYRFDFIITISVPHNIRVDRLLKRGLSSTQIEQRIKAQASDAERESISDSVIVNDNDLASLTKQVEDIWIKLTEINRLKK